MPDNDLVRIARDWPGKSNGGVHPALWHMLDVGAVARHLLARRPLAGGAIDGALAFLVALHDIGKISSSFRAMLCEGHRQHWKHWKHSAEIFLLYDNLIADVIGGEAEVRKMLFEAVAGHHGGPRCHEREPEQQLREIGDEALADAAVVIRAIGQFFGDAGLEGVSKRQAAALSWKLNGLTVQSDWIGSNTNWFTPKSPETAIADYWMEANAIAAEAIADTGLYQAAAAPFAEQKILDPALIPHPMQVEALRTTLPEEPSLAVIEDATGAGKTEAALILAARMMAAGKATGLFFALPTMATANAMLSRLERVTPALFEGRPTLALSHGAAGLSDAFRKIKGRDGAHPEAGPYCGRWLSDDRRLVLLADVGVGTIDQALLAVLPTRFNGLRLRALADHVLIVDEAHSYDPYMEKQLMRLLQFQARLGGSAILMTATLPGEMKAKFVEAFQKGRREKPPAGRRFAKSPVAPIDPAYPALTIAGAEVALTAVNPAAPTVRDVKVTRLAEAGEAIALIRDASRRGAACLWVRNAVDDAIAAVRALRAEEVDAELLHARFAICDRLVKEADLLSRFGPEGEGRAGRVLVATQVAEQSLDLDFDVMISDLAPVGAMIQRAGRLWRHMGVRPAAMRPVPGPHLHVLSPDPDRVEDARWVHQVLDKGAWVYPPPEQWRSAKALFDAGAIRSPGGLRALIGAVYGEDALDVPDALKKALFKYEGQDLIEGQMALNSLVDPDEEFAQERMQKIWDDEQFPTRLGVPQVTLALAREGREGLVPYACTVRNGCSSDGWALSEVQLSKAKFSGLQAPDQQRPDILEAKKGWSKARAEYTIIAPMEPDGTICAGLHYNADLGLLVE